jgi:uncharacterized protein (TIGR03790 family)
VITRLLLLLALLSGGLASAADIQLGVPKPGEIDPDVAATLVVYNENDPESKALAQFYVGKRGIPKDQVVGLKCATTEEINRAEYDTKIAEPLRTAFTANFWWKLRPEDDQLGPIESCRIRYVALMRGIPLKIAPQANYPGDKPSDASPISQHNEASVESELSVLCLRTRVISGANNNSYYRAFRTIHDAHHPEMLLVTRLDGPSAAVVRRMITDAIETERTGLRGLAYIDARGITDAGLKEGDEWLEAAANTLQRAGVPVVLDQGPGMFPDGYPMRNAAIYLGWYSAQPAGPFTGTGIRFRPGAIACHIHSFSASTVRHPQAGWVGPLLQQGATAVTGNVYEPYLALTPNLDVLTDRLKNGFTFAESCYMSERALSWMTTFCGDPLYRPFPILPPVATNPDDAEFDTYKQLAQKWFANRPATEEAFKAAAREKASGLLFEGLGLLQIRANDPAAGIASFDAARLAYSNEEDIMRATIHELIQLQGVKRAEEAVTIAKAEAEAHKHSPAVPILKALVPAAFAGATATPAPPAPKPAPKNKR